MKYMLLIQYGTAPVPGTDAWDDLTQEEQKAISTAYQAINATDGVTTPQDGLHPSDPLVDGARPVGYERSSSDPRAISTA